MAKYYYENKLSNQNLTAKPNVAWVADITSLELGVFPNINIFLCIDIHTNIIVAYAVGTKTIESKQIIRKLKNSIEKRFLIKPNRKLIIHTDRGTQFSAEAYHKFLEEFKEFVIPSMSRPNTPTDNAVAERFMRTFKEHKIKDLTLEERIQNHLVLDSTFNSFRRVINQYVKSINETPNRKSSKKLSPQKQDINSSTASMLMIEPRHHKVVSIHLLGVIF